MISIQILAPTHVTNPKDAFVVTCGAMMGDGDEFHDIRLAPIYRSKGYDSQLEELIDLLDAMKNFQWQDENSYSDLENFAKWFPRESDAVNGWSGGNPFLDDGFIATLDNYEIAYYDLDGIEHAVSIDKRS
jgi:hypothetical protein